MRDKTKVWRCNKEFNDELVKVCHGVFFVCFFALLQHLSLFLMILKKSQGGHGTAGIINNELQI